MTAVLDRASRDVLAALSSGTWTRTADVARAVVGDKPLTRRARDRVTKRLRALQADGLVERREVPVPRVGEMNGEQICFNVARVEWRRCDADG